MLNSPFGPWPNFTDEEAAAVQRVLLSNRVNYWTGEESKEFEREFAVFAGTNHAIALANGTLALDLALYGLKIGARNGGSPNDEVVVTPRTFIASISAIVNAGAVPVFADVDIETQNISAETVAPHISMKTRAIICVHLAGWPCDIDGFRDLIGSRNIHLIEDCAQAHGARYKGRPVGGLGDVAAWSFCQDKIMTTGGEGGMVTCNDPDLWSRMWSFKDHGKSWDAIYNRDHPPGFRWLHETIGTNWRLTEMQSAIGRIQLKRMPEWHAARTENARVLFETFLPWGEGDGFLRLPASMFADHSDIGKPPHDSRHAWYRFYAFVRPERLPSNLDRDVLINMISDQGLPCMHGSCSEVYLEKAFNNTPSRPPQSLPNAKMLGETSMMFFTHPGVHRVPVDLVSISNNRFH